MRVSSAHTLDGMAASMFIPSPTRPVAVWKLGFEREAVLREVWPGRLSDPLATSLMVPLHQMAYVAQFSGWQIHRTPCSSGEEYTPSLLFHEGRFSLLQAVKHISHAFHGPHVALWVWS